MSATTLEQRTSDHTAAHTPAILRFDKRRTERHATQGSVTAVRRDHDPNAYRHPLCPLKLVNMSAGGMAGVSAMPMEPGERVWVCFGPHGNEAGFEMEGRVVRCNPARIGAEPGRPPRGYEVAVCFDIPAAA